MLTSISLKIAALASFVLLATGSCNLCRANYETRHKAQDARHKVQDTRLKEQGNKSVQITINKS